MPPAVLSTVVSSLRTRMPNGRRGLRIVPDINAPSRSRFQHRPGGSAPAPPARMMRTGPGRLDDHRMTAPIRTRSGFTAQDYRTRMMRASADAADADLAGVIVTPGPDLVWLTGYRP